MSRIEVLGTVDDQHRLNRIVPDEIKVGPIKVILESVDEEEDDWFQGVAATWAREYHPREDIYTLQDGVPFDEAK
ncbi:MAG: hypothetical protein FJ303_09620 [Planctomycetes bacterium]|nr:hypothetical protein [Planctomycetota bacterium]